jgi:hypothetical protein
MNEKGLKRLACWMDWTNASACHLPSPISPLVLALLALLATWLFY